MEQTASIRRNGVQGARRWLLGRVGVVLLTVLLTVLLGGCGDPSPATEEQAASGHTEQQHPEHAPSQHAHAVHPHPVHGPHQGPLIELGDEAYHAEWVVDVPSDSIAIYILDGQAETEVAIDKDAAVINLFVDGVPRQIELVAHTPAGDGVQQASRFDVPLSNRQWLSAIGGRGQLRVMINGKSYRGSLPKP